MLNGLSEARAKFKANDDKKEKYNKIRKEYFIEKKTYNLLNFKNKILEMLQHLEQEKKH